MILCDVCEAAIEIGVCPFCDFDNGYQEGSADAQLYKEMLHYVAYNPDCNVDDILEAFGCSIGEFNRIIREYSE